MENIFIGPRWDLKNEFPSFESKEFQEDLQKVQTEMSTLRQRVQEEPLNRGDTFISWAQDVFVLYEKIKILLGNLQIYTSCHLSVDGRDAEAKKMEGYLELKSMDLARMILPFYRRITLAKEDDIQKICSNEETKGFAFQALKSQFMKDYLLSPEEESMIKTLEVDGLHAWGKLYKQLATKIKCDLNVQGEEKNLSLTQTIHLLSSQNENERRSAYEALKKGWGHHDETCASILNSLAGFRLKLVQKRSFHKELHYLDPVLSSSHLTSKSLNALISTLEKNKDVGRAAQRLLATLLGKQALDPWDLLASTPKKENEAETKVPYKKAIEMIEKSFSEVSPLMGIFVRMADKLHWIDGSETPNRQAGGYCTKFSKFKESRIFMTYRGSLGNVSTLAHELGHAYHSWVMRDLPFFERFYPMPLAETASIFSETLLFEDLLSKAQSPQEKRSLLWEDISNISTFLLDIPNRYTFERELYDLKSKGEYLSADTITQLNNKNFKNWYGETLKEPHSFFWMSKLHYYMSQRYFYNFPYSFGYLFALKVYSKKEVLKDDFHDFYVALLRDTGRMEAEELVKKHFNEDLEEEAFWGSSISMLQKKLDRAHSILSIL